MARRKTSEKPGEPRRIVRHPRILGGKPVIEGTRISVERVLGLLAKGSTIADIVESHPHLKTEDVRAAIAYAREALRDDIVVDVSR